jgi:kanamycin kinase
VIFIDKDDGYFLKVGKSFELDRECELTRYFHQKDLAANVVEYISDFGRDYLLTERIIGQDCTAKKYLERPERLAETLGQRLSILHSVDGSDFSFDSQERASHTERYLYRASINYLQKHYDSELFSGIWDFASIDEAHKVIEANKHLLKTDTLLHGDYCLPNVILNDWRFSGFVDLGSGGLGDKHVDLFWGVWTLNYNLKTNRYRDRFLDAYGRQKICESMFRVIAACESFL